MECWKIIALISGLMVGISYEHIRASDKETERLMKRSEELHKRSEYIMKVAEKDMEAFKVFDEFLDEIKGEVLNENRNQKEV